jgi:WD40 repeat protein
VVVVFSPLSPSSLQKSRLNAVFSPCGQFVIACDEVSRSLNIWELASGQLLAAPFNSGHTRPLTCVAASPADQSFMTCR